MKGTTRHVIKGMLITIELPRLPEGFALQNLRETMAPVTFYKFITFTFRSSNSTGSDFSCYGLSIVSKVSNKGR